MLGESHLLQKTNSSSSTNEIGKSNSDDWNRLNQIDNSHLQQWIDKIEQLFHHVHSHFEMQDKKDIYFQDNNSPEAIILTSLNHQDQILLQEHLKQVFTRIIQENFTLFKIILEEYPSLIRLLNTIISLPSPNLLLVVMRPVLNHLYLLLYKSIVETDDFSEKPKIINRCLNLLGKCIQVRTDYGHKAHGSTTDVLFEFEKNIPLSHSMEQYLEQIILEKCYDIKINRALSINRNKKHHHVNFLRSCLCFLKLGVFQYPLCHMAMIQYISIFIDNIDWSNLQDIIILTLAHELISSKDEEIVSLSQKTKIASSNMTILSKLFTELLESMLKQPFKSVHNFTEYRILSECIRTNASICIILENFIENLFLECNNNFRILYAAHDIFSPLATNALPLETLDTTHLIHLSEDISTHWIRHQFKSYDWFLRSMVYVFSYVIRQYQQPRRDKNQQFEMTPMFRQSLVYLIRYIFGHDLSKDFELAQDSLLHIIQTLSKCEKISHSQFLSFIEDENMNDESGTTSFQPVPIHSLINLYMSMIFVRHDSKNFTYDQVIDLFLNDDTNQDFSIFTEKTLIILRWMDQMILLLNSPSSSMDTPLRRKFLSFHQRQLILLLGYLRVLPLFKKKCKLNNLTSHTSLSSLLLKFQEEYYEPLVAFWNHYKSNNPSTNNNLHINAFQTANHSILSFSQVQKELEEESSTTTTTTSTQHQTLKSLHGRDPLESGQNALSKHQILLIPLILSTFERISLFDDEEEVVVEDDGGG